MSLIYPSLLIQYLSQKLLESSYIKISIQEKDLGTLCQ